jgi:hypothetical protein
MEGPNGPAERPGIPGKIDDLEPKRKGFFGVLECLDLEKLKKVPKL